MDLRNSLRLVAGTTEDLTLGKFGQALIFSPSPDACRLVPAKLLALRLRVDVVDFERIR